MRILFITQTRLWPLTSGGRQRTLLVHRALRELGEVETALIAQPGAEQTAEREGEQPPATERVKVVLQTHILRRGEHPPWRWIRPLRPALVDRLAHNVGRRSVDYRPDPGAAAAVADLVERRGYDVIVGRYLLPTVKSGVLNRGVPVVVDVDDVDFHLYMVRREQAASAFARFMLGRQLRQVRRLTVKWLDRAAAAMLANPRDRALVACPHLFVLPNIPFPDDDGVALTPPAPPAADARAVLLMVGTWNYPANVRGLDHFLERSWPVVRARAPQARLRIVGAGMSQPLRHRWSAIPGVEAVGFVDDLAAAYRDCGFTIAPVHEGGGSKIKVLESLLRGRTMAVTPHALRGFEEALRPGEAVLTGDGDAEFAKACVALLNDPATADRLAATGWAAVRRRHSFAAFAAVVREAVSCALADAAPAATGDTAKGLR